MKKTNLTVDRNEKSVWQTKLEGQKDLQKKLGKISSPHRPVSAYKIRRPIAGQ